MRVDWYHWHDRKCFGTLWSQWLFMGATVNISYSRFVNLSSCSSEFLKTNDCWKTTFLTFQGIVATFYKCDGQKLKHSVQFIRDLVYQVHFSPSYSSNTRWAVFCIKDAPGCGWDLSVQRRAGRGTSCWWVYAARCSTGPRDVGWYWRTRRRPARLSHCAPGWWVPASWDPRWRHAAGESADCAAVAASWKFPTKSVKV